MKKSLELWLYYSFQSSQTSNFPAREKQWKTFPTLKHRHILQQAVNIRIDGSKEVI